MQGWLMKRNTQEAETIRTLFENSFPLIYTYALQNLIFKMDILECMVIAQVSLPGMGDLGDCLFFVQRTSS